MIFCGILSCTRSFRRRFWTPARKTLAIRKPIPKQYLASRREYKNAQDWRHPSFYKFAEYKIRAPTLTNRENVSVEKEAFRSRLACSRSINYWTTRLHPQAAITGCFGMELKILTIENTDDRTTKHNTKATPDFRHGNRSRSLAWFTDARQYSATPFGPHLCLGISVLDRATCLLPGEWFCNEDPGADLKPRMITQIVGGFFVPGHLNGM